MRGRKKLEKPSDKHAAILGELRWGTRPAVIARVYDMTRQSIQSIVKRWPEYAPKRRKGLSRAKNR